jgi:general secretion pathway protein I
MNPLAPFRRPGFVRGFTLLEVLVAVAILGLGLSVILGAQTGLFSNAKRAQRLSLATGLARCRMSELELELLQNGYPLVDQESEGECCMDEASDGFTCSWKIQRVELPEATEMDQDAADGGVDTAASEGVGPFAALSALQKSGGAGLGENPDIGALAEQLTAGSGESGGLVSMVMGLVYPSLKPMLEASIRKVTVDVKWKEGVTDRSLQITQYVTDPKQGELDPELDPNLAGGLQGGGSLDGGT